MGNVSLGSKRTLTVPAATVVNLTLPFSVRRVELEKQNQPEFYININSAIDTGALDEARLYKADILSFDLHNEPTAGSVSPGIDHAFSLISFYGVAEFTINFLNMTASASST